MGQYSGPERIRNDAPSYRAIESITGATDTWTIEDSGTLFLLNRAAGIAITPPTLASAYEVGFWCEAFVQTTFTGNFTFTAAAADLLLGNLLMVDTDTGDAVVSLSPDGSDDLIVTLNGTTTGGLVNSRLRFEAVSTSRWLVSGVSRHSSNVATPFS